MQVDTAAGATRVRSGLRDSVLNDPVQARDEIRRRLASYLVCTPQILGVALATLCYFPLSLRQRSLVARMVGRPEEDLYFNRGRTNNLFVSEAEPISIRLVA